MRGIAWVTRSQGPLLAAVLSVALVIEVVVVGVPPSEDVPDAAATPLAVDPAAILGLALAVAIAVRRRAPLGVLALALVTALAAPVGPLDGPVVLTVVYAVVAYSAGANTNGRSAILAAVGIAALIVASATRPGSTPEELSDLAGLAFVVAGPWLAGIALRERRARERLLEERAASAESDRDAQLADAVARERSRIARELHDVVAHAISVVVLQARGARHALDRDPAAVRDALVAIDRTSTEALTEMRRLVGILRSDGDAAELAPRPGLAALDELIGRIREAGLDVDLSLEGQPVDLPPGVDLAAYRIVQEALSNAVAHAGPATVSVRIRYSPAEIELEVVDSGIGPPPGSQAGHGLLGMRERVSLYGGRLVTAARPGGGYRVHVVLPLEGGS